MPYSLEDALRDPLLSASSPRVVTGGDDLQQQVRWAHASEQLDVAPLLLGGELLITEGTRLLENVHDSQIRAYVDALAEAGIAGLAIERSVGMTPISDVLVEQAVARKLVVLELRRRVPFVQICQSINMRLSELASHRVQLADVLSGSLTSAAVHAVDLQPLLTAVAHATRASVAVVGLDGDLLATAPQERADAGAQPAAGFAAPLEVAGEQVGTLVLSASVAADIHTVAAALERAPGPLAIGVLRWHPPTSRQRLGVELLRALRPDRVALGDGDHDLRTEVFLRELELPTNGHYLAVNAEHGGDARVLAVHREAVLHHSKYDPIFSVDGARCISVMSFDDRAELVRARSALLVDLQRATPESLRACVGAGVGRRADLPTEVRVVVTADEWARSADGPVVDVLAHQLSRLRGELASSQGADEFVREVLGDLLTSPLLLNTLFAYAACWGSKTATARTLGIGRQALYDRLARIEAFVGPLDASPARNAAIITAALLHGTRSTRTRERRR